MAGVDLIGNVIVVVAVVAETVPIEVVLCRIRHRGTVVGLSAQAVRIRIVVEIFGTDIASVTQGISVSIKLIGIRDCGTVIFRVGDPIGVGVSGVNPDLFQLDVVVVRVVTRPPTVGRDAQDDSIRGEGGHRVRDRIPVQSVDRLASDRIVLDALIEPFVPYRRQQRVPLSVPKAIP